METIYIKTPVDECISKEMESCVLALGFFDGVHLGHQGILKRAKQMAKKKQCTFGVMTFYPHPKDILFPDREPMTYLTPLPLKEERFKNLGVEKLFVVEFTPDFARLSPEEFVQQYIIGLRCVHVVAGFDYHYGSKGIGNMKTMSEYNPEKFEVTTVHKIEHQSEKISSTAIRNLLEEGHVGKIPKYLGDYYEVYGEVKQNSLFYKNHQFIKLMVDKGFRIPKPGVYQMIIEIDDYIYEGTCQQISFNGDQPSLLIQLNDGLVETKRKRIKVKWVNYLYGKPKDHHSEQEYMEMDMAVI